jgi:hypothetical protein
MSRTDSPCWACERSRMQGYEQQVAAGLVRCTGFDNDGQPEQFVPYDSTPPCPLFNRAKNRAQREKFVAGLQYKPLETA